MRIPCLGVTILTSLPMTLLRVQGSLIWWWPLSSRHSLTIALSLSLVLIFLFSLLECLSIDFPSHMIVSMLDIYQDLATCDKLNFPSTITRIFSHAHVPFPSSPLFPMMGAIRKETLVGALLSWWLRPSGLVRSLLLLNRKRLSFELLRILPMPLDLLPHLFHLLLLE